MRIPLLVLGVGLALFLLIWLLVPVPEQDIGQARTDLPWQIETFDDGSSQVFGLRLYHATLADAVERLGPYEELALFESRGGGHSLEAFFGNVSFGPLKAKVVVTLAAPANELKTLAERAQERKGSPSGDWKLLLNRADLDSQLLRPLSGLTYIPAYGGLEAEFFRQRLGEPDAWRTLEEGRVQWFYPAKGLSLLLDAEGKEVLEYVAPRDFRLPDGTVSQATDEQVSGR